MSGVGFFKTGFNGSLLVEREYLRRQQQRLQRRLKQAKLFVGAAIADVDFDVPRGLKKAQFLEWALSSVASRPSQLGAAWPNGHWQDLSKRVQTAFVGGTTCRQNPSREHQMWWAVVELMRAFSLLLRKCHSC